MSDWTFFSNYGHVLVCLARDNEVRLRDVALETGITERAVQKIVRDMQDADFVTVTKQGRCNRYRINKRKSLRHGLESHCTIGKLLALVTRPDPVLLAAEKQEQAQAQAQTRDAGPEALTGHVAELSAAESAEPKPASKPAPKTAKASDEAGPKSSSVTTRQQGSLF